MKVRLTRLPWPEKCSGDLAIIRAVFLFFCFCAVSSSTVTFRVLEESKPGAVVGNLSLGTTSFRNYKLEGGTAYSNYFAYNKETGIVNTTRVIDRDVLSGVCSSGSKLGLLLFVSSKHLDSPVRAEVIIVDINDNSPKFPSTIATREIPEASAIGYGVRIPVAKDPDCGSNGTVSYSIMKGNNLGSFTLHLSSDTKTLNLKLLKKLDRETDEFHILNISACDEGTPVRCSSILLNVTVTDYNDNKPLFHNVPSRVQVKEKCDSGKSIMILNVTDADSGTNAMFTLSFKDSTESIQSFKIDPANHELKTIGCLKYDKANPSYTVGIEAKDHGHPVQRNDVTIQIDVVDINDHDPIIKEPLLVHIKENALIKVAGIIGVDDDDAGQNANVTLKIISGNPNNAFYFVRSTHNIFTLKLNGTLDREEFAVYNITVQGFDHGIPPRSSTRSFIIPVIDVNDNPPICQISMNQIYISESAPVGSYVTIVHAVDKDEGKNSQLKYILANEKNHELFKIVESSGLLTTNGPLDHESQASIELKVIVQDNGDDPLSSSCSLIINITDTNDNEPLFTNPIFNVAVSEDTPVGTLILSLVAFDADKGDNSKLTFSMLFPLPLVHDTFYLNSTTGTILTLLPLDREIHNSFHFTVVVQDHGNPALSSPAIVNITILDVNDNSPVIYPKNYYSNIFENQGDGFIVNITATDIDSGRNGSVDYEIVDSNPKNTNFHIDKKTGSVTTTSPFDSLTMMYTLKVVAKDGQGVVSSISSLHISVITAQDDLPHFEMDMYIFNIEENVQSGTYVGCIKATRKLDSGTISYILYNGDPKGTFSFNNNGEIRTSKQVDSEEQRQFKLQVMAKTAGPRILIGWTTVIIVVKDVNDNPPSFQYEQQVISIKDTAPIGSFIYEATVFDPDLDAGGIVKFELSYDSDKAFDIDTKTGNVIVAQDLSQSTNYTRVITIMASDCGLPSLTSVFYLTINVININIYPPVFQSNYDLVPLARDVDINQPFLNVTALDPDGGINGKVYFYLSDVGNSMGYFGIFPNGMLFVQQSLHHTNQSIFLLEIIALDTGHPALNSSAQLNISIVDTSEHQQLFKKKSFKFEVYENESPGTFVGKIDLVRDKNPDVVLIQEHPDFTFDPVMHEIRTQKILNRERLDRLIGSSKYTLFAKASYKNQFGQVADLATIEVQVKDKNDHKPVFGQLNYVINVQENEKPGTTILKLSTSDQDKGENAKVNFSITAASVSETFHVDGEGNLLLNRTLKNKSLFSFNLTVQVTNIASPYFHSKCHVKIMVNDVNNNRPEFTKSLIIVNVSENFPLGQNVFHVAASDKDYGRNSRLAYIIKGGNTEGVFNVDRKTGKVTLARKLDFETEQSYVLNIMAVDSGVPPLSSTQTIIVNVTDVNDNPPYFYECILTLNIQENVTIGTAIGECLARDKDSGINGMISYSILKEKPKGNRFKIDPSNGTLYIHKQLDREEFRSHQIQVGAKDQAVPKSSRLSCTKTITINLLDINDNFPQFTTPPSVFFYPSAQKGDDVMTLTARDLDAGLNGNVTFSKGNGEDSSVFNLDSTGRIVFAMDPTNKLIYKLNVIVSDMGTPAKKRSRQLSIFVVGGSGLSFLQKNYSVSIVENEPAWTFLIKVTAVAVSLKTSTQVKYFMTKDSSEGLLVLNSSTGVISTNSRLDREGRQGHEINLVIYAIDLNSRTPKTSSVRVHVSILDENDNTPTFSEDPYVKDVSEDTNNGSNILTLQARDDDDGRNGSVVYNIVGGDDGRFFRVNKKTGQVYLEHVLDHELQSSYILNVTASDDGKRQLSSWSTVLINVLDVNDNIPVFKRTNYSFTVVENSPVGTVLGKTIATDRDSGDNGQVRYTLNGEDSNLFRVDAKRGVLKTASQFDRETIAIYLIKIVATDQGKPVPLSSSVFVYVSVLDINDNNPTFNNNNQPYQVTVLENSIIGTTILTLNATDKDFGFNSQLIYYISGGNDDKAFGISSNGILFTTSILDRESKAQYDLQVTASDSAPDPSKRRSSSTRVIVNVMDVNDHTPYFESDDVVHVREDQTLGRPFTTVVAVDGDTGVNGQILYELQGVVANEFFQINRNSGALSLKKTVDREKQISGYINVTVEAKDRGQSPNLNRRDIKIIIDDVNDNSPVFYPHKNVVKVYENISIGSELLQITAVDIDQGSNGLVEYVIVAGNVNKTFVIHPIDGIVTVVKPLDREVLRNYQLKIRAFDLGRPQRENATMCQIQVLDVNDNPPRFKLAPVTVTIMENIPSVQNLATFAATDDDEGRNGEVMYNIVHESKTPFLYIDVGTGTVSLISPLDREKHSNYLVVIEAKDNGIPPLYTQTSFTITVGDDNDNSPVFVTSDLKQSIFEGSPVGSRLCVMNATDADYGKNGEISYTLENHFSRFRINSKTGEILTTSELDRELLGSHFKLTVNAKDGGTPSRETSGTITGYITDIDDNKAKFEFHTYSAYIYVSAPLGTFVTSVLATDKDEGLNGKVGYAIKGGDSDFYVESDTGNILTKRVMPSSTVTFSLKIQAMNSNNHEDDTTVVDITVTTQIFPVFDIPITVFNISEDAEKGHVILRAKATDDPAFHIASGNLDEQFNLDVDSRNLTLNKELDYEKRRNYSLWLKASLNTYYSSYINIQIFVLDVNDNKPIFQKSHYQAFLTETDLPNATVTRIIAKDYDSGLFGFVEYSIVEKSAQAWFRIGIYSGYIYTTRGIDRELNSSFDLTIQTEDQGFPRNTNKVSVHVTIVDANDNPPVFDKISPVYILENTSPISLVTTVFAKDKDETSHLTYSLARHGNYNKAFSIRSHTGQVFLIKKLDREIVANYLLTVIVTDGKFSRNVSLNIIVQDVDDNPPKFPKSVFSVKILELKPIGSIVIKLNVSDDDVGPNADVVYSLKRTATSDKFRIDNNGIITVSSQLQFVKPNQMNLGNPNEYNLTVLAENPAHSVEKASATIVIEILDANDHSPVFVTSYYYIYVSSLSQKGANVLTVKATDIYDTGRNSEVLYKVVGGNATNVFQVGSSTGHLTVDSDLTSFVDKVLLIELQAQDRGEPIQYSKTNAKVFIMITIENKHPPVFTLTNYEVKVKENYQVGKEFLRVKATDSDSGINGRVSYSVLPGKQGKYFSVDTRTGSVTIANVKLDYEYLTKYVFDIEAKDGAPLPKSATATVQVTVTDYNDNPPVFEQSSYQVNVFENSPIGSVIVVVSATDRDNVGSTISYTLAGMDKDVFLIDEKSGKITTKIMFDYESRMLYKLNVLAKDNGDPQKTSACDVVVRVKGVNEFTPLFSKRQYTFSTPESSPVGFTIGHVLATDGDKGSDGVVQYILVDPSGDTKNFNINQDTGDIIVANHLDSETTDRVQLTVLVKNPLQMIVDADNTDKASVVIKIGDSNDPPRFLQKFVKIRIDENVPVGTLVGNFSAVDDDVKSDFASPFKYSILLGNFNNSFLLVTVGEFAIITTAKPLDREKRALYNLTIAATDITEPSLIGIALLIVELKDVNDNAPFLKPGICPGHVKENLPKGTVVLRLDAFDRDIDPNKDPYSFQIISKERVPFIIDSLTWELKTNTLLDREKVSSYSLLIQVHDSGYPKKTSVETCGVIVDDVNDNPPSAETRNVKINVPASGFSGGVIGDVTPVDVDQVNSYVCEVEGRFKEIFNFLPNSCTLNMKKPQLTSYVLNVRARDGKDQVSYSLRISFNKISDITNKKSVILRLSGLSPEQFLALMDALPCKSGYVSQILSIQSVNGTVTAVLMAYLKNDVYISKEQLSQLLKQCKNNLETLFTAKIINTNYNLCSLSNTCIHGECQPHVTLSPQNRTTLYSKTNVFVSAFHKPTVHCVCYAGYSGKNCEHSTRVCLAKPCKNGGTCLPKDVGFTCQCPANYKGKLCNTPVDLCSPNPCNHSSKCISSPEGPKCQCDFGGRGKTCELTSIGFQALSYIKLPTLQSSNGMKFNNITLQFATIERNALILFNRDYKDSDDSKFIALEIIGSVLRFSFNLGGGGRRTIRIVADNSVSNGQWHTVTAVRNKLDGYLYVDEKVFHMKDDYASNENLELQNSPLYFGGVPSLDVIFAISGQVSSHDFVGCMRDVYLNGAMLDLSTALMKSGIISGCPRIPDKTCPQVCGSSCVDKWFTRLCQCSDGVDIDERCSEKAKPLTLRSGSVLQFQFDPSYLRASDFLNRQMTSQSRQRRNVETVQTLFMNVRSRNDDVLLWRAQDTLGNYTELQIKAGIVSFSFGNSGNEYQRGTVSNIYVNDGYWFNVTLTREIPSNALTLTINGTHNQTYPKQPYVFLDGTWTFGSPKPATESTSSFQGCLSSIKINNELLSLDIRNQYGILTVLQGEVENGCESPDFCSSNPCSGEGNECVNNWKTYSCVSALETNDSLSVGAIAAIVFFCILLVAIIVAVIAIKKRRTRNEFASGLSRKENGEIEEDNSRGSSSSESIPSRKTPSRHSLDSGVDIHNTNASLSPGNTEKTSSVSANVIALGSPDEYTIVTSRRDSGSDQRDTGFTDSECEYGVTNLGANLNVSSIPSNANSTSTRKRQSRSERAPFNYDRKVPYLINRGYLKDTRRSSRSTTPSDEPESIEMQNYSIDIEEAEQYSIGSLATYSDLNYSSNPTRSLDTDRLRYKPSLERFSESGDSGDGRQLSNLPESFEPLERPESSGESSDGGFTVSEYDYERRPSYDDEENRHDINHLLSQTDNSDSPKIRKNSFKNLNIDEYDKESSVDGPCDPIPESLNWDDVLNWGTKYNNLRDTCQAIAQLRDADEDVEIV